MGNISLKNTLTCLNSKFQNSEGKLWTNTYPNNAKAQIGYKLIKKKWINSSLNCEAYSSFEVVSCDHRMATVKLCLSLSGNVAKTAKIPRYDCSSLNRDISNEYMVTVRNKFDTLQEISESLDPNDVYENFVNTQMEAAVECIPTKPQPNKEFQERH